MAIICFILESHESSRKTRKVLTRITTDGHEIFMNNKMAIVCFFKQLLILFGLRGVNYLKIKTLSDIRKVVTLIQKVGDSNRVLFMVDWLARFLLGST